jgi:hypothetical protein
MAFVLSLGELVLVQPFRVGFVAVARALGWRPQDAPRLHVPSMSADWLRQFEADAEKHHPGL